MKQRTDKKESSQSGGKQTMHNAGSRRPRLELNAFRLMSMHGYVTTDKEGNDNWKPFRDTSAYRD